MCPSETVLSCGYSVRAARVHLYASTPTCCEARGHEYAHVLTRESNTPPLVK